MRSRERDRICETSGTVPIVSLHRRARRSATSRPANLVTQYRVRLITQCRSLMRSRGAPWALALTDQLISGGVNFVAILVLGRVAGAHDLGMYALAMTVFYLILAVQESLITMPYTIFGARLRGDAHFQYSGAALCQSAVWAIGVCIVAATVALFVYSVFGDGGLARVIGAFALAAPLCLLREFGRRYLFAHMQVARVVAMSIAASSTQLIVLALFAYAGSLSACTALLAMGFGSGLAMLGWLRLSLHAFRFDESLSSNFLLKSWGLGRWIFASETTAVISANVMPWLIVFLIGPAATGIFAACDSILRFTNPVVISMTNVITSKAAIDYSNGGKAAVRRIVRNASAFLIVFQCAFCILLVVAGEPILKRSFGDAFATYWPVLAVLGLNQLVAKLSLAPGRALMLVDRVNVFLWAEIAGLAISLVAAIILTPRYGVLGAAWSLVAGNVLLTAWTVGAYFAVMRDDKKVDPILIGTSSATALAARGISE